MRLSAKYCRYNDSHRESSLKNAYKQLLKHGYNNFENFSKYVSALDVNSDEFFNEMFKMCKGNSPSTFFSLVKVMSEISLS